MERRREERNRYRREVSGRVIDAYREIASEIGQHPAFDYAKITGGQGPQNGGGGAGMFTAIDFTADVKNAVRDTLIGPERDWYLGLLKSHRDHADSTPEQDKLHHLVARAYLERGIYPMAKYFNT